MPTTAVGPAIAEPAKWYHNPAFIGLGLLCCFPVGLAFLWTSRYSQLTKWIVTGITAVFVLVGGVASASSPPKERVSTGTTATTSSVPSTTERASTTTEPSTTTTEAPTTTTTEEPTTTEAPTTTASPFTEPPTTEAPQETRSQSNARRKAQSYLDFSAFSRTGLIKQLEFEGFSNADAIYGVDSLGVNWNEQAAKKAEDYLSFMSFSRSGLYDQLIFEGFTPAQATYGVNQTGL